MSEKLFDEVPSLDLADFLSDDERKKNEFVQKLGEAYNNIGFVAVKNHFLTDELSTQLYDVIKRFFQLEDEKKAKYEIEGLAGQRGYIGKGKEHAKGRKTGDLKEFYHIGQEVTDGDAIKKEYPDNIFPEELPQMKDIGLEVYQRLEKTGVYMLRAIALYLGLDENYFDSKVKNGNSILRPIHYFPIENPAEVPEDAVRAAEHGDINLITLLMGASADGLQVLRRDGKWIPITALPEQLVVNVGDMLERHTNGKLKSTIHRVVNPPRELMGNSRYSIPFFMHPRSDMDLTCLDECIDAEHPKSFDDITAGEFLNQRLAEIGLKK
ncbi:isopenicillin N synthase family dioxygenase [Fulvivirga lutimaris]|uniref:isopenicillin N synthase family dioxygenase n=1 Tax=Fulvivirga lutimaris TaxID=1819566 RepID=UPI0012BC853B|nr:2-oxoglutarate and iron-dependent oxygenase domain-containing protein [Fulvivirga lutimaris]MTI40394.1 isopenicillin N synthase family oxygenase [Fulvivirga lutimaris]